MIFDKLDFVKNKQLFNEFLEYQYGEYLEVEREALIESIQTRISVIHVEALGGDAAYSAYDGLPKDLETLKRVDKELIHLHGLLDQRPDSEPEEQTEGEGSLDLGITDIENQSEPRMGPVSEAIAEELALEEEMVPQEYLIPEEEHLEPENPCPVCGAPGYYQGSCARCGFDEAEGVECPRGCVRPLEKLEACKGCASYKRKYLDNPAACNYDGWLAEVDPRVQQPVEVPQ